tara:strand:+ start:1449 stop:1718 length:270 start_codon:yes stop_codon:yes gene_type:complete
MAAAATTTALMVWNLYPHAKTAYQLVRTASSAARWIMAPTPPNDQWQIVHEIVRGNGASTLQVFDMPGLEVNVRTPERLDVSEWEMWEE